MKLINSLVALFLIFNVSPARAEVFKCKQASGKVLYQSTPCASSAAQQQVVNVKEMTPEEREDAKMKLRDWQDRQAAEDAVKKQAEKERQDELMKQESLELQRRSVAAQEQQAINEQQRQNPGYGVGFYDPYNRWNNRTPYYPYDRYPRPGPNPHQIPMQPKPDSPPLPPPQPIKPGPIHLKGEDKTDKFGFK